MKNWKRLLSTVLAAALFMTQPGGVTFAGAVGRVASAAADAVSTAAQYMSEAVQNVMIPLPAGPVVRAAATYSIANDTAQLYYDTDSGAITGFAVTDSEAFDGNLVIPASINDVTITSIADYAFYYNSYNDKNKIVTVDIPETVTSIGKNAFSCENLTTVTGAEGVTAINDSAFMDCYKLSSIPDFTNLTSLGQQAFSGTALSSVTIPAAITEIPQGAFSYVSELTQVTFLGSVTSIGNNAFSGTGLTSFTVPESVTSIGSSAFFNCASLAAVTLPSTLTTLGNQAFSGCTALQSVSIPGTVQTIPQQAFSGCTALESVTLGDGVQSIGQRAFDRCSELTSINFPSTLTTINGAAFRYCGFTSIEIPSTVTEYTTYDGYGYAFDHCGSLLTAKVGSPIIPTSMFSSCGSLQEVELEEGVTQILGDSFQYCRALEKIIIPKTVTYIESPGFYKTETFAIYGYPNSYAQTYANENGFNFVDITLQTDTRTLTATVQAPEGEAAVSPEDYTIRWFNAGGTTPISTGTTLSGAELDKTYDFEIILSDELAALYEQPARQSIAPEDAADITVTLVRKAQTPTLTLTGKAVTESGATLSGVQVSTTDMADTAEPITGVTDDEGVFSLTVPAKTLYLTMRLNGYYSKNQTLSLSGAEAGSTHNIGNVIMHETMAGRLNLTLTATHASAPGTEPLTETLLSASGLDIHVTRNNESFADYEVQGTSLVFLSDAAVQSGDAFTITVTDRNGDFSAEPVTITHDGDAVQTAQINLVENGAFVLGSLTGVNSARALVFDAGGAFLQSYTATSGLQSDPMPDGTYTLVVLQNTARLQKVPALSVLQSLGLEQGTDYVVQSITIKKGELAVVGDLTIPELNTDVLRCIVPEETFVTTNVSQTVAGTQFLATVQYTLQDEAAASPDALTLYLPEGVQPLGALTVDNRIQAYSYDENTGALTVSGLPGSNGAIIRLYCTASVTGQKNISACLTLDTGVVQPLGSTSLEVTNAQMDAPEVTATSAITVGGKASPGSSIKVYEDDVLMGSATANAVGSWSLTFELKDTYQYSYHFLHAEISADGSEKVTTDEVMVTYDGRSYGAELEQITMYYIDHNGKGAQMSFDYSGGSTAAQEIPYYYITPGRYPTFTFEVEFSGNNEALADVYVLTRSRSGDATYVKTTRNGDKWVGTQDYSSMSTVPAEISAVYVFEDTPPIEFSEAQFLDQASELVQLYGQMGDAIAEAPLWTEDGGSFAISDTGYTISDDTVAFTVLQQDESGDQTPAFDYKLERSEDMRDALELEDSGYYPINDDQTIYSTFTFDEQTNSLVTEFVDTEKQIRVAETCTLRQSMDVPEAQEEPLSRMTAVLARAAGDDSFWDNLFPSDWTWAENLADWADLLTLIPGVGNVASVTKDFIELSGEVTSWIKVIKGNEETLLRSVDELYMLLELRCPDGSRKLNDSQYNALKNTLDFTKQEITTYTDNCKLYIGAATAIQAGNLLFSALCLNSKIDEWVGQKTDQFVDDLPDCMGVYKEYYELRKYWNDTKKWKIGGFEGGAGDLAEGVVWTGSELAVEHLQFLSQAKKGLEGIQKWVSVAQEKLGIDVLTVNGVNNYIYKEYKTYEDRLFEQQKNIRDMLRGIDCPDPEPEPEPDPDPGDGIQLNGKDGFSDEYELLFGLNGVFQSPSLRLDPVYDPAGFVYEAVPSNRLEGVTATVYYQGADEQAVAWNAADYDQINPQITGSSGMYAWFVPEGQWIVKYTKDGYKPADSSGVAAATGNTENPGWLPVPPPQFEVNVGMVSTAAPTVERVIAYNDRIEVAFSQYMDIESVQAAVSLSRGGQPATVTVTALDAEDTLDGSTQYATRFSVTPADGDCTGTITVSTGAKNYAATSLAEPHTAELTAPVQRPTGIVVSGQLGVVYRDATTVTLTLHPGIAGKTLEVESLTPSLLSATETVTTGADGTAALTLTGLLPGDGLIRVTEPESGLSETISVPIAMSADELTDAEKPAPVAAALADGTPVTSGMVLESNTQITLNTTTPNAEIRYTLDGTCPCKDAALTYTGPITITENTVLRAAALLDGVYSDTIRLELTVANGTEEPENPDDPGGTEDPDNPDDPGGSGGNSGGSSSGGGGGSVTTDNRPSASAGEGGTVTAGDGTVTITPDEGYQIGSVTVNGEEVEIPTDGILTGLDADDEVTVAFERITDDTGLPFADVAPASWYADAVQYVYENGMMNGTSDTLFSPDATVTRAMIVTILYRLENAPAAAASGFTDVAAGMYYADAVGWAAANGIVNGVSETRFAPDDPIIREQLAAILYRYAQFKGYAVTASADLSAYTDAAQISAYATAAMQWANAEGLINGDSATTINPQGNATRAEAATILMRFCQDIAV